MCIAYPTPFYMHKNSALPLIFPVHLPVFPPYYMTSPLSMDKTADNVLEL